MEMRSAIRGTWVLILWLAVFSFGRVHASGWNDYELELEDGYSIVRASAGSINLYNDDLDVLIGPEDFKSGSLHRYQIKDDYILTQHVPSTLRRANEDPFDYSQVHYFVVEKESGITTGPLHYPDFGRLISELGIHRAAWTVPKNPDPRISILGSAGFLMIALLPVFFSVVAIIAAVWVLRKIRKDRGIYPSNQGIV